MEAAVQKWQQLWSSSCLCQLSLESRLVRLVQSLPAERLFEQERCMGGVFAHCFQAA